MEQVDGRGLNPTERRPGHVTMGDVLELRGPTEQDYRKKKSWVIFGSVCFVRAHRAHKAPNYYKPTTVPPS
jgi:hypothetical protein